MGKTGDLKKTRRFRSTAPKLPSATTLEEPRSRGQRKRALKKVARVSKLGLVLRKQQYDGICEDGNIELTEEVLQKLPSCRDAPELGAAKDIQGAELQGESSSQRVFSNKIKKDLLVAEFGRISGVLGTRSFQQDPFAAIQTHLVKTESSYILPSQEREERRLLESRRKPNVLEGKGQLQGKGFARRCVNSRPYKGRRAKMKR